MNACVYDVSTAMYKLEKKTAITVKIHPSSCLSRRTVPAFVFTDLVQTSDTFARDICMIDPDWISDIKEATKRERQIPSVPKM